MTYRFEPDRIYRMPTHFGPQPGPRQQPDGVARDWKHSPRTLTVSASFLTDAARLERHLPEGFALVGEPVVTVRGIGKGGRAQHDMHSFFNCEPAQQQESPHTISPMPRRRRWQRDTIAHQCGAPRGEPGTLMLLQQETRRADEQIDISRCA